MGSPSAAAPAPNQAQAPYVSVVIPVFNLNLIIPAILGFVFLNEPMTASKILGLIFAGLAVFLLTR